LLGASLYKTIPGCAEALRCVRRARDLPSLVRAAGPELTRLTLADADRLLAEQGPAACARRLWANYQVPLVLSAVGAVCIAASLLTCCCFCCAEKPAPKSLPVAYHGGGGGGYGQQHDGMGAPYDGSGYAAPPYAGADDAYAAPPQPHIQQQPQQPGRHPGNWP
jgi:hypothetical protein